MLLCKDPLIIQQLFFLSHSGPRGLPVYREAFKSSGGRPGPQPKIVPEKRSGGQSPKNKHGPKPKKQAWAKAQKIRMGQSPKNMPWPMQKIIIPKGAARSAAPFGFIVFLHWPRHVFSGFGPSLFFGLWPMLIFRALAHAYFLGFAPCLFFPLLFLSVARAGPRNF